MIFGFKVRHWFICLPVQLPLLIRGLGLLGGPSKPAAAGTERARHTTTPSHLPTHTKQTSRRTPPPPPPPNNNQIINCGQSSPHDWSTCPLAHANEKARRRDPRAYDYLPDLCQARARKLDCAYSDACPYAHNVYGAPPSCCRLLLLLLLIMMVAVPLLGGGPCWRGGRWRGKRAMATGGGPGAYARTGADARPRRAALPLTLLPAPLSPALH